MHPEPEQLDALRRIEGGELAGGPETHTDFARMRALLRRGWVSRTIDGGRAAWALTDEGRAMLGRGVRVEMPADRFAHEQLRQAKAAAGER